MKTTILAKAPEFPQPRDVVVEVPENIRPKLEVVESQILRLRSELRDARGSRARDKVALKIGVATTAKRDLLANLANLVATGKLRWYRPDRGRRTKGWW